MRRFLMRWAAACALFWLAPASAEQTRVAVAANFAAAMPALSAQFNAETGHHIQAVYGATGGLVAQIQHGAPFDVLLAADMVRPQRLVTGGQAVAGSLLVYARGRLVLWSADPNRVDAQGAVLTRSGNDKLALADPKLAPYGAAALETLTHLHLVERTQPRWVMGSSIAQAHQFVASGNAQLGFVAMSQVFAEGRLSAGSGWVVPATMHAPIEQGAVLLTRGVNNPAAQAWLTYLQTPAAKAIMRGFGYE